jgi:hypothetical protein
VRFQPVPVISTYDLYGGSSVVDMDWLEKNPVTFVNNPKRFRAMKVSYSEDGRGYLSSKRGEMFRFSEKTNPEVPISHCNY